MTVRRHALATLSPAACAFLAPARAAAQPAAQPTSTDRLLGESAASGYAAYSPGASTVPMLGLAATVPIAGPWAVQLQWRRRWLDDSIRDSPIVDSGSLDSGHVALTYEFK
jgi:hypothetical protein